MTSLTADLIMRVIAAKSVLALQHSYGQYGNHCEANHSTYGTCA